MLRHIMRIGIVGTVILGLGIWIALADQYTGGTGSGWYSMESAELALGGPVVTISSAADQVFITGEGKKAAAVITVTDSTGGLITAANDLRLSIPSFFGMNWFGCFGNAKDESDNLFKIIGSFAITAPAGGENWRPTSEHTITWTNTGTIANVCLEYSPDGAAWKDMAGVAAQKTTVANVNSYTWTVPDDPSAVNAAIVRVSDALDDTVFDPSAGFTIKDKITISVSAPASGEILKVAGGKTITWTHTGAIGDVKIEYSTDGGFTYPHTIIASTSGAANSYSWTNIPDTISDTCKIKISDIIDPNLYAESAVFKLKGGFTIVIPSGTGISYKVGATQDITWTHTGTVPNVKLSYAKDGVNFNHVITDSTANDNSHPWTIPDVLSATVKVKIEDVNDTDANDVSDNNFTITYPTLTLTDPDGGEEWNFQETHAITWTSVGTISDDLTLEYYKDDDYAGTAKLIASGDIGGMVGYWKFDTIDVGGGATDDSSGNGNTGTITGATLVNGKIDNALSFDGVDDYVDCGNDAGLNITDAITVKAWVKLAGKGNHMAIISKRDAVDVPYELIYEQTLDRFQFTVKDDLTWHSAVDTISPTIGVWYHLVGVMDGTNLIMYRDEVQTVGEAITTMGTGTSDVTIGRSGSTASNYFNGLIDEVVIYDRALTAAEVAELRTNDNAGGVNDGSYSWKIPYDPSSTLKVKISENFARYFKDASTYDFGLGTPVDTEISDTGLAAEATLLEAEGTYATSGTYTSRVFDTTANVGYGEIEWNVDSSLLGAWFVTVSDVSIGVPGASGFGVGVCPALPDGFSVLPGTMDKTSDNYGNYQYSDDSIMVWIPKFYYKVGTGANGLAVNVIDVRDAYYYASRAEAEADGYALHRAFIDGGEEKAGFFIDKYMCSNNGGTASSIKDGDPISTASVHNPISGLDACTGNYYYEAINAAGGRGANFSVTSRFMRSALAMLSMAHGQAASDAANCAWYDAAGITNFPKGLNNNRTPVEGVISNADCNDSTITYISDGYSNCGKTGSGLPFARTTHNGQASGVADLNGLMYEIDLGITRDSGNTGFYMLKEAVALKDLTSGLNGANDAWGDAAHLEGLYDTITIPCITGNDGWIKFGNGENQVLSEAISGDGFRLSALGIPEESAGLSAGGTNLFGVDGLYRYLRSNLCLIAGGGWSNTSDAGVWYAFWDYYRTYTSSSVGFRAACYLE